MNSLLLNPSMMSESETIFDVLNIDLNNINRALNLLDREIFDDEVKRVLFKQKEKEVFVFDKIEIQKLEVTHQTKIYLKQTKCKSVLFNLKTLMDKLCDLYGKDDFSRNKFSLNDLLDLFHGNIITRSWQNATYPVELTFLKGNTIELVIHLN
ncbi:hypothetical protein [Mesonia aestuariivivens]|uniref:Uncharacterized protein n=1 Tax=Mesonia aestuariivivens TaxID=2796128 RepID=A0ABS6W248_9FLAO|nr:hypothetical protein [Mesonia aestuariivivens]MBW2961905.1 hypothetical protein [Mesonia aestuariivivens]